ncbi:MAG: HAMP domain-containing sensor histidine kinase [Frankiaceae bacterium]
MKSRWRLHRPRSLGNRLALLSLAATAAWVTILTVGFNVLLGIQLRAQADSVLRARAVAVTDTIDLTATGGIELLDPHDDASIDSSIWIYQGRSAVQRPAASARLQRAVDQLVGTGERYAQTTGGEPVRLFAQPIRLGSRQVGTVVASLTLEPYERTKELTQLASAALAGLLLAAMFLVTRLNVKRALRPVAAMTAQAAEWSSRDVRRRFGAARRPLELEALAITLDGLLDRLSAVLRHEQQLTAELSHELRTPLARIMVETELAHSRPREPTELAAALTAIATSAEQMNRILETLLAAARAEGDTLPGRCEVQPVLDSAVAAVNASAASAMPTVLIEVVRQRPLVAGVGADVLDRIVAPLLENAVRHAQRSVTVRATAASNGLLIEVADDGPGVPNHLREEIFEPGRRGDPTDGHPGAGLGLALARRLAEANGGSLSLRSEEGGATFVVLLPAG